MGARSVFRPFSGKDALPRVGEVIRKLRLARGLSIREVAEAAGLSSSFLGAVERGESDIAVGRLAQVAGVFGHDVASLLGYVACRSSSARKIGCAWPAGEASTSPLSESRERPWS